MMQSDRPRAALSHIEALENEQGRTQRTQLWRAEVLRRIGRLEVATVIYGRLTGGCMAGEAYHGLGKTAGVEGDWLEAERMLGKAVRHDPISPSKHNDLGYAHLKTGATDMAIEEFRTALELDPGRSRAANNLVLAFLVAGAREEAERIRERLSIDEDRWQALQRQARGWEVVRETSDEKPDRSTQGEAGRSVDGEESSSPGGAVETGSGSEDDDGGASGGIEGSPGVDSENRKAGMEVSDDIAEASEKEDQS
ncbi:tetratricopeptide repeat protein [Guyparkeria sp.]|uniref:tetratricopeptide repeat protein n=1 Tax=Guyparkeria sp. TaxID=2035736 RepID=UPI00397116C4